MDNEDRFIGLFIDYRGSAWTPDHVTQYASFSARMNYEGFSGTTEFEATGDHIAAFVQQLKSFYQTLANEPTMTCGVGDDVYFSVKFSRFDLRGCVLMEYKIRKPVRKELYNSIHGHQVIELHQISELIGFFQSVLSHQEPQFLLIPPKC